MEKKIKQKSVDDIITIKSVRLENKGLTSLEGSPEKVYFFNVSRNNLKNLIGSPKIVKDYYADYNQLETLEGSPEEVDYFDISHNPTLKNTDGIPKRIGILDLFGTIHSASQFTEYPDSVKDIYFDYKIPIEDVKQIVSNIKEVGVVYIRDEKYKIVEILKINKH
ncbi:MAG: hypothetical protein KatS3mg096_661 [Candidatus Parcubacteria bacterium]|nr:MAG: hypothetical protein KatS3mg096_661 [Candidatus Parcubacteria bacterium]